MKILDKLRACYYIFFPMKRLRIKDRVSPMGRKFRGAKLTWPMLIGRLADRAIPHFYVNVKDSFNLGWRWEFYADGLLYLGLKEVDLEDWK